MSVKQRERQSGCKILSDYVIFPKVRVLIDVNEVFGQFRVFPKKFTSYDHLVPLLEAGQQRLE